MHGAFNGATGCHPLEEDGELACCLSRRKHLAGKGTMVDLDGGRG